MPDAIEERALSTLQPLSSGDDTALLKRAFGSFPSGVVALCSLVDGESVGMVASSFTSVSISPPLVSICIQSTSRTWIKLREAGRIGISCLAADQDRACRQLAAKDGDRFAGLDWRASPDGAIYLEGATALFDCTLLREIPAGDHEIALFDILAVAVDAAREPLVFHASMFRVFERNDEERS